MQRNLEVIITKELSLVADKHKLLGSNNKKFLIIFIDFKLKILQNNVDKSF